MGFRYIIVEGYVKAINFYVKKNGFRNLKKDDEKLRNINKIIQGLGSSKESEEGFVKMGSKGQIKEGLKYLQKL